MSNLYIKTIELRRTGGTNGTYNVWVNGKLVEGGFFSRHAANAALDWWRQNYRHDEDSEEEN
jgi:hypothetical protein